MARKIKPGEFFPRCKGCGNPVTPDDTSHAQCVKPHEPRRDDDVAEWLKEKRDAHRPHSEGWEWMDWILDEYRLRADLGKNLTDDLGGSQ